MIGSKEFFEELREGEAWCTCIMREETYKELHQEYHELIVLGYVRQKNSILKDDIVYKGLYSKSRKAKKDLIKYEFEQNHKK